MPEGIVYILTNSAMDDIIKIGRTDNLQQRMRSLYTVGVPAPFTCYYAARVAEAEQVERNVHEIFANERVNKQREFFSTDPHRAALVIKMVALEEVSDRTKLDAADADAITAADKATEKRRRLNFAVIDISVGEELTFANRDDVKCTVHHQVPAQVEYDGVITTLSASARTVLGVDYGVQGALYWMYDGETLNARRLRMENDSPC